MRRELTEVFPIRRSLPRAALVHREGVLEQQSSGMCVSMKDSGVMKDHGLVLGKEIEPFTREGR